MHVERSLTVSFMAAVLQEELMEATLVALAMSARSLSVNCILDKIRGN